MTNRDSITWFLACVGLPLLLFGCQTVPPYEGPPVTVEKVVTAIKKDVGVAEQYLLWARAQGPLDNICRARVEFELMSVKVTLSASAATTSRASVGATIPIGEVVTVSPAFSSERQVLNTQSITFYLFPKVPVDASGQPIERVAPADEPNRQDPSVYPITEGLRMLRDGLLAASNQEPCFRMAVGQSDKAGALDYGFTLDETAAGKGEVKFVVFSLGTGSATQNKASNAVSVGFRASGTSVAIQPMRDGRM